MQLTQPLPMTSGKVEIFVLNHVSHPFEDTIKMSFIPAIRNFYKQVITLKSCLKRLGGGGGGGGGLKF